MLSNGYPQKFPKDPNKTKDWLIVDVTPLLHAKERAGLVISGVERVLLEELRYFSKCPEWSLRLYGSPIKKRYIPALQKNLPFLANYPVFDPNVSRFWRLIRLPWTFLLKVSARLRPFCFGAWEKYLSKIIVFFWYLRPSRNFTFPGKAVFYSCFDAVAPEVASIRNLKKAVMIHDIYSFLRPDLADLRILPLLVLFLANERNADILFAVSEYTRQDYLSFYPSRNQKTMTTAYLGAAEQFARDGGDPRKKYGIPEDCEYLLSVATLGKRKNLSRTIRCFAELVRRYDFPKLRLVLCGRAFDDVQEILQTARLNSDRVILTGFVEDGDMPGLYRHAAGYVFLSQYEGFGLPLLEAMQCKVPILCSNVTSLPEIAGSAALYVAPENDEEIILGMWKLLQDAELRQKLVVAGKERVKEFSWRKHGEILNQKLREVVL